jgi:hypothetical protein
MAARLKAFVRISSSLGSSARPIFDVGSASL